ncbi:MAG TPA: uroporphyrinogen-III synthase, partial [Candidatus Methanofastidiosa archaeon]|nr:uroporphyrinogen-III synthase [Candidatus Methanofastidiosa archaeon]
VVITSANTVPLLKDDLLANRDKSYVAIGPGTKRALEGIGLYAEMPDEYTSEGLVMLLRKIVKPQDKVVGLRSSKASNVLGSMLTELEYSEVPVYDIDFGALFLGAITEADVIFFTSTAMVNAIAHMVKDGQIRISIGPQTTAALKSAGIPPHMESAASTIESMIGAATDLIYQNNRK